MTEHHETKMASWDVSAIISSDDWHPDQIKPYMLDRLSKPSMTGSLRDDAIWSAVEIFGYPRPEVARAASISEAEVDQIVASFDPSERAGLLTASMLDAQVDL